MSELSYAFANPDGDFQDGWPAAPAFGIALQLEACGESSYLLLGDFYADAPSLSFCNSEGVLISNVSLPSAISSIRTGAHGGGFVVVLQNGLVKLFSRDGIETLSFHVDSGGTPYNFPNVCFGDATQNYVYVCGDLGSTIVKRFTFSGVFVDEMIVSSSSIPPITSRSGEVDEIWISFAGVSETHLTQYIDLVEGVTHIIDNGALQISSPDALDIDEDGFGYGLCVRNEDPGYRIIKTNMDTGVTIDFLTEGDSVSYNGLSAGGKYSPIERANSMIYVTFAGESGPGTGFVRVYDAGDASLLNTFNQSGGTDAHYGVARLQLP